MEESERERTGERESESDGGEQVNLCASEGAESNVRSKPRNSLRKSSFEVELKTFEIEVEKKKGKVQVIIVERKRGVSSWVKMGPESLGLFVESLDLCIKDTRTGKWVRNWKKRGRIYLLLCDENKGGMLHPSGCRGSGEEKVQHLYPQRKRSERGLGFNGGDASSFGCCYYEEGESEGRGDAVGAHFGEKLCGSG